MSSEKMREEFEAWASKELFSLKLNWNGEYKTPATRWTWAAWQASRAAVVIELPAFEGYKDFVVRELQGAFTQASEAAGLKVKP